MATTLSATAAAAACDAIVDLVDGGNISWETAGDIAVCETTLANPAFSAATSTDPAVATLLGVTLTSSAAIAGPNTVTKGKFRTSADELRWTASVGTSGEDINFTSNILNEDDQLNLTAYTFSVTGG